MCGFGHFGSMDKTRKKKPKTPLQALFLSRVEEELEKQELSRSGLCRRPGGPSQSTFNEVMNGSDPRLETVAEIAAALDVPAWTLLTHKTAAPQQHSDGIYRFPSVPKSIERKQNIKVPLHDKAKRRA